MTKKAYSEIISLGFIMALAKVELEHKTVVGQIDQTIADFLRNAPQGSELNINNREESAEIITIVEFPEIKAAAKEVKQNLGKTLSSTKRILSSISFPAAHTSRRVHQH